MSVDQSSTLYKPQLVQVFEYFTLRFLLFITIIFCHNIKTQYLFEKQTKLK